MPKAEATTGLAPKKASATSPLRRAKRWPSEGFGFGYADSLSLVEPPRSGGLGLSNAKDRRAGFARRSICLRLLRLRSAARIGDPDGLAQRRAELSEKALSSNPLLRLGWRVSARPLCSAPAWAAAVIADGGAQRLHPHIAVLESHSDAPVQALLDAHLGLPHSYPNVLAVDLIELGRHTARCSHWSPAAVRRDSESPPDRALGPGAGGRRQDRPALTARV